MSADRAGVPAVIEMASSMRAPALQGSLAVPAVIANAGDRAARRFLEFFAATIRNKNTRLAYYRAACSFFGWFEQHGIAELVDIEPIHVSAYVETLLLDGVAKPTAKQHLAAIRMLFDWLVVGQVLATNPAHAVRGPKHVVKRGKTPVLTAEQARQLLDSIDVSTVVGLQDRALIAVMTYALARVGDGARTSALRALSPGDRQAYPWRRGNVRRRTRALPNAGRICRIRARDHPGTDTCRACQGAREGHQKRQADRSGEDRRNERSRNPHSAGKRSGYSQDRAPIWHWY